MFINTYILPVLHIIYKMQYSGFKKAPVVYHSLKQVVDVLTSPQLVKEIPDVQKLIQIGRWNNILDVNNNAIPARSNRHNRQGKTPFIVVEGLDGSGKTLVSTGIAQRLGHQIMQCPPNSIKPFKKLFDAQPESIRRAFYSFGNYLAASQVQFYYSLGQGVIMDRYWHSTAAFALAHEIANNGPTSISPQDFVWPNDLLQPDLVAFLMVREETRRFRLAYRNTTNTKEEQALADSASFRHNLIDCYIKIQGPEFLLVDVNNASPTATPEENAKAFTNRAYEAVIRKLNIS